MSSVLMHSMLELTGMSTGYFGSSCDMCECVRPVVGLIRGLHAAAKVLQVKAHDVI